jgi:phosphoribosyl 1,2-cyclic phosphodiesterase
MIAISLQSGSNGNCIYVEAEGQKLLFDAGISGVKAERRLAHHGRNIRDVNALIISHEHGDHARSAGVFNRKYGVPVYITQTTLDAAQRRMKLGRMKDTCHFISGQQLEFGPVLVETVATPHDGVDGVAFVITSRGRRLGLLTDLGHVFDGLADVIASLDAVFIESNYDRKMLTEGPYPHLLKKRIMGPGGHLSNEETATLLKKAGKKLTWVCLAHLSEQNNTPPIALETYKKVLGDTVPLVVASRYGVGSVLSL